MCLYGLDQWWVIRRKKVPCHLLLLRFNWTKLLQKQGRRPARAHLEPRYMFSVIPSNVIGH